MSYYRFGLICILFSVILTSNSCGGDDRNILVQMELQADLEVPAGLNNLETHFFILRDQLTQAKVFLQDFNPEDIGEILPAEARITSRNNLVTYAIIDQITIRAISSDDATNNKEVFFMEFIPIDHRGDLQLFGSLSNVKDIMMDDTFDLEVRFRFRNFTPTSFDNRIFMTFNVYG